MLLYKDPMGTSEEILQAKDPKEVIETIIVLEKEIDNDTATIKFLNKFSSEMAESIASNKVLAAIAWKHLKTLLT